MDDKTNSMLTRWQTLESGEGWSQGGCDTEWDFR